jgi:hypothetical protein
MVKLSSVNFAFSASWAVSILGSAADEETEKKLTIPAAKKFSVKTSHTLPAPINHFFVAMMPSLPFPGL